jgi:hypothetical protein
MGSSERLSGLVLIMRCYNIIDMSDPDEGSIIEVQPFRVKKSGEIIGNVLESGCSYCTIIEENLDIFFSEGMIDSIFNYDARPFRFNEEGQTVSAKVISPHRTKMKVKLVGEEEIDGGEDGDKSKDIFESTERDQPREWEGTPQNTEHASSNNRQSVFKEDDPRGSKNDLI